MVDVSRKADTPRTAVARATASRLPMLIPTCHQINLSHVSVALTEDADACKLHIEASASCLGATGVEMEALTAASVAALTVYGMCKAASKAIEITEIRLLRKTGGKSGEYTA
ncbi:MAG: hypothetical protein SGPRY_006227 [Prymnesium sp.]